MSKYKIYLMEGPAIPFIFATHHWFVVQKDNQNVRYEVTYEKAADGSYLRKNLLPPFYYSWIPYNHSALKKGRVMVKIEGNENSSAAKIYRFIVSSPNIYPHARIYRNFGPNSNTYIQWILDRFPGFLAKLPANAVGKNYKL